MREKKLKTLGREAHPGRVNKKGQSWGSETVSVFLVSTHEEVKVPVGPGRCTCNKPGNEIRYDTLEEVPVCQVCGLSYETRPESPAPKPKNKLKSTICLKT